MTAKNERIIKNIDRKSEHACTIGAKGRVFPEALTQSALAGGGVYYFAGKMHGTFIKHRNLQHFWAQTGSPNFKGLELCSKDCDK